MEGFVAVGAGPLDYDPAYVQHGAADEKLVEDMKFLAEQMKLRGPPLHIATKEEKRIFNDFLKYQPSPTLKSWRHLATHYKTLDDYQSVFPKLPTMLASYYGKWKHTQELVMIKDSISAEYYGLLKELGFPLDKTLTENPAAAFQKESSAPPADDTVDCDMPTENERNLIDLGTATGNILPVGPLAAPGQVQYNVSTAGDGRSKDTRRCSGSPFGCKGLASACSGRGGNWTTYKLVATSSIKFTKEEADRIIKEHHRETNRLKERQRKAAKKAAKAAANG